MDDAMDDYPKRLCCGTRIFMDDAMEDYPTMIFHG